MIISASRRTDIPAFFGNWFVQRIKAGFLYTMNPLNPKQIKRLSLLPRDVDAIVFWSKNPKPFFRWLDLLDQRGLNYYFQFTLNDYSQVFEPSISPLAERIKCFQDLSKRLGSKRVIWRYDPIILSSVTPVQFHAEKLAEIASHLGGYTQRLVISFVDYYGKVKKRLRKIGSDHGIEFKDITAENFNNELATIGDIVQKVARQHDLGVYTCAEAVKLDQFGIRHGSCIDMNLIMQVFNVTRAYPKDKGQRNECFCAESVDVGVYNTCKAQCAYCYANTNPKMVQNNLKKHVKDSPALIGVPSEVVAPDEGLRKETDEGGQGSLF